MLSLNIRFFFAGKKLYVLKYAESKKKLFQESKILDELFLYEYTENYN